MKCLLNGLPAVFEIDTGSNMSTVSMNVLDNIPNVFIRKTKVRAKAYNNDEVLFLGETMLNFKYNARSIYHRFLVVQNNNVSLSGRDLCQKMNIRVEIPNKNIFSLKCDLENKYKHYFSSEFMSNVKEKVALPIKGGIKPIFCKARSVPLRYRALLKAELGIFGHIIGK